MKTLFVLALIVLSVFTADISVTVPAGGDCSGGVTTATTGTDTVTIDFAATATWADFATCLNGWGAAAGNPIDVTAGITKVIPPTAFTAQDLAGASSDYTPWVDIKAAAKLQIDVSGTSITATQLGEIQDAIVFYSNGNNGTNGGSLADVTVTYSVGIADIFNVFAQKSIIDSFHTALLNASGTVLIAAYDLQINYLETCSLTQADTALTFTKCQVVTDLTPALCVTANSAKLANALTITASTWTGATSQGETELNTCLAFLTSTTNITMDISGSNMFQMTLPTFPSNVDTLDINMAGNGIDQAKFETIATLLVTAVATITDLTITFQEADPAAGVETNVFTDFDPLIAVTAAATVATGSATFNVWVAAAGAGCVIDGTKVDNGTGTPCAFGSKVSTYFDETAMPTTLFTCSDNYDLGITFGNELQATAVNTSQLTFVITAGATGTAPSTAPTIAIANDAITVDLETWQLVEGVYTLTISDATNSSIDTLTHTFTLGECKSIDITNSSAKVCEDIVLSMDTASLSPSGEDITGITYTWSVTNLPTTFTSTLASTDYETTTFTIPQDTLTIGTTYVASLTTLNPALKISNINITVITCATTPPPATESSSVLRVSLALLALLALFL